MTMMEKLRLLVAIAEILVITYNVQGNTGKLTEVQWVFGKEQGI